MKIKTCKHTQKYAIFDNGKETSRIMREFKEKGEELLPELLMSFTGVKEVLYEYLSDDFKKTVDDGWSVYDPMRCSELHGNMEREVQ